MEQRTSVMISAILFAVVVAGSIAYLLYSNPKNSDIALTPEATPTETVPTITPELIALATPTPTPTFVPVATQPPVVAAAVAASAPTGSAEWLMAFTALSTLAGAGGLVLSSRLS